jgi:uncharacterized protein
MNTPQATESALTFRCGSDTLVGILHSPAKTATVGMVIIVGGPQYRAGSHRQFVLLARAVADQGFAVLRFDYRGMGDSGGGARTFESVSDDVTAAVDELCRRQPEVRSVVLWGLCDGASAALLQTLRAPDRRVGALCLVNPWARTETGLARTQLRHYYINRLLDREFWTKLLRGGIRAAAAADLLKNMRVAKRNSAAGLSATGTGAHFLRDMALASQVFRGRTLVLCSGADLTAKEFQRAVADDPLWHAALQCQHVEQVEVPQVDHTFSNPGGQALLGAAVLQWLLNGRPAAQPADNR